MSSDARVMLAHSQRPLATYDVPAELAPIGVQLWPTVAPRYAPNFTLARVEVVREVDRTFVRWIYESGAVRVFRLGEVVVCSSC